MGTHYYSLPTVDPDSTLSFPDAVNGLGNSTDAVLHGIQEGFKGNDYHLPTASADTLGGVRIGKGFKVYSDGLLTTSQERFKLKPATADTLGGVYIGKNVTVDAEGRIGVGTGAFGSIDVGTAQLEDKAVTTEKFADASVNEGKAAANVISTLTAPETMWKNAERYPIYLRKNNSAAEYGSALFRFIKVSDTVGFIGFTKYTQEFDCEAALSAKHFDLYKNSDRDSNQKYSPGELGNGKIVAGFGFFDKSIAGKFNFAINALFEFDFLNAVCNASIYNPSVSYDNVTVSIPGYYISEV